MSEQHVPVTGGCSCGAIRFESSTPPESAGYCYYDQCRKSYGSVFASMLTFSWENFQILQGQPACYQSSEIGRRAFCSNCGSPIYFTYKDSPLLWVLLGALDHPEEWPFEKGFSYGHTFLEEKPTWYKASDDNLPRYARSTGFLTDAIEQQKQNE